MLFLGIGAAPGLIKNTGLVTNIGPSPAWQPQDPNGYACNASGCRGQGLSDLLFRQLQAALNKTNAALSLYYRQSGTAYPDPQVVVNGVLDAATTASVDQISMTNMVPGFSYHLDSAGIAANAGSLISSMNNWLSMQTLSQPDLGPCDPLMDKNCFSNVGGGGGGSGSGGGNSSTTKPIDTGSGRNNGGSQPTIYYCADGSKVTDPGMCQTAPQMYVCWDGSQVTDPALCAPYPTPPQSDSNSVSPPAPSPTIVSVSTAPNGAVTVNTAPAIDPATTTDTTPHLFGFPRNWVIGGFVAAGAALGIGVAIFSLRRRTAA